MPYGSRLASTRPVFLDTSTCERGDSSVFTFVICKVKPVLAGFMIILLAQHTPGLVPCRVLRKVAGQAGWVDQTELL